MNRGVFDILLINMDVTFSSYVYFHPSTFLKKTPNTPSFKKKSVVACSTVGRGYDQKVSLVCSTISDVITVAISDIVKILCHYF